MNGVEPSPTTVTMESHAQEHVLQPADTATATADGLYMVQRAYYSRGAKKYCKCCTGLRSRAAGGEEKIPKPMVRYIEG